MTGGEATGPDWAKLARLARQAPGGAEPLLKLARALKGAGVDASALARMLPRLAPQRVEASTAALDALRPLLGKPTKRNAQAAERRLRELESGGGIAARGPSYLFENLARALHDREPERAEALKAHERWLARHEEAERRGREKAERFDRVIERLDDVLESLPAVAGSARPTSAKRLSPAHSLARASFEEALYRWPHLAPADGERVKYPRRIYDAIKEYGCGAYALHDLPSYETWKRYLRAAHHDPARPKVSPRGGRSGRSIVERRNL